MKKLIILQIIIIATIITTKVAIAEDYTNLNESLFWSLTNLGLNDTRITSLHPNDEGNFLVQPFLKNQMIYNLGTIALFVAIRYIFFEDNNIKDEVNKVPNTFLILFNLIEMNAITNWGVSWSVKYSIINF